MRQHKDNDQVTRAELRRVLARKASSTSPVTFGAYYHTGSLADAAVDTAIADRNGVPGNSAEVITEIELEEAMAELGWGVPAQKAKRLFGIARNRHSASTPVQVDGDQLITRNELDAALVRMRYTGGLHADNIVRNILEHREPKWEFGDVVRDANGCIFKRAAADGGWWTTGNSQVLSDSTPKRPLTRLVEA